jgi:hypothetical protein
MEPEGLLPDFMRQAPFPVLGQSSAVHARIQLCKIHFNIVHLHLGLPSGRFSLGLPTKTLYVHLLSPVCTSW